MPLKAHVDPAALDALLAPYDTTSAPGYAVGVALDGRPLYRRGVGMASIELPVSLSPSMRMRIGSTSKHFTVLAVMLLVEEQRLSLDDSPRQYIAELPAWADSMTVRQLMAHTSGMRDSLDLLLHAAGPGKPTPDDFHLRMLSAIDSVNFAPGVSWNYNNGGYVLLSEIVARLSGQSFAAFLKERIFDPVGMIDTLVRPLDTDLLPNSATLHVPTPAGGWVRGVFGSPIGGEGGIVSTVDDMLRWLRHMDAPTIGSAGSWAEMRTPLTSHGYGLGLFMNKRRGLDSVHHAGAVVGGSSQMIKLVDQRLDIVAMTNGRGGLELYNLVDAIIAACIPDLPAADQDVPRPPVTGIFHSTGSGRALELLADGDAQILRLGAMKLPAVRDRDGAISVAFLPSDLQVRPIDDETVIVREFGESERLSRVYPPADPNLRAISGRYQSRAAGLEARIDADEDGARMRVTGEFGSLVYALAPIGHDLWEATATGMLPLAATLEFGAESFRFTSGRTVRLPFDRMR